MITALQAFLMAVGVAAIVLVSVLLGGFLVFRSKAAPGEGFLRTPRGEAFTIKDAENAPDEVPDDVESEIKQQTDRFLKILGG